MQDPTVAVAQAVADSVPTNASGPASKLAAIAGLPTSAAIVIFFGWMLSAILGQLADSNRDAGERWKIVARLETVLTESTTTNREMKAAIEQATASNRESRAAIAEMTGTIRSLTDEIRRTSRSTSTPP